MILNRLGNKSKLAPEIQKYFPNHSIYIEPFFGAGGMFFNKPKSKYNFLNDLDTDVYNLFRQVVDNYDELIRWIQLTPITETQFKAWGRGDQEDTPLMQAVRFLFLSNFGLYGKADTLRIGAVNPKQMIVNSIEGCFDLIKDCYFFNTDFRKVFAKCDYRSNYEKCFCYADPPYLETGNNYSHSFTENDSFDLFETLQASGVRWAMSEFDHPFIIKQAQKRGLNINYIANRVNLKNMRTEILVTNYDKPQLEFSFS